MLKELGKMEPVPPERIARLSVTYVDVTGATGSTTVTLGSGPPQ